MATPWPHLLFGDVNPSGKLPLTFPVKLEDSPVNTLGEYPSTPGNPLKQTYKDDIYVGYRYFGLAPLHLLSSLCYRNPHSAASLTPTDVDLLDVGVGLICVDALRWRGFAERWRGFNLR